MTDGAQASSDDSTPSSGARSDINRSANSSTQSSASSRAHSSASANTQYFPTTHATTIIDCLRTTDEAPLAALAGRIIERYAEPLEAYARGSSLREIAEPRELVHGFLLTKFDSPASTRAYLGAWNASGLTLRRWMMNGLLLYVRGVVRDMQRSREKSLDQIQWEKIASRASSAEPEPSVAFERAWARAILAEACAQVEQALVAEGRDRAWEIFRRHSLDGLAYGELVEKFDRAGDHEYGLTRQQMAELVRGVTTRLRARVRELLEEEGRFGGEFGVDQGIDEIVRIITAR